MDYGTLLSTAKNYTLYRNGDKCLKVFAPGYPKSQIFSEAGIHTIIEETRINIPNIREVIQDGDRYVIIYDYIPAVSMAEIMHAEPENVEDYIRDMVELQVQVHSERANGLIYLKHRLEKEIFGLNVISDNRKRELTSMLMKMPSHNKLCHGNFVPGNILVTAEGEIYLTDWQLASGGNAAADVANTYLTLALDSTEIAEKYLSIYCEKAETKKEYARAWIPIVAASQLSRGVDDERKKILLFSWLDVYGV